LYVGTQKWKLHNTVSTPKLEIEFIHINVPRVKNLKYRASKYLYHCNKTIVSRNWNKQKKNIKGFMMKIKYLPTGVGDPDFQGKRVINRKHHILESLDKLLPPITTTPRKMQTLLLLKNIYFSFHLSLFIRVYRE